MESPTLPPEPPEGWREHGACRGTDPSRFFAEQGQFYTELPWQDSCPGCEVRAHCLATAILNEENWGIWGGLTPAARFTLATLIVDGAVSWEQIVVTFHGRDEGEDVA